MRWIWWLLGLAAAGGVVYVISTHTGKPVPKKDACIVDMPKDRKAQVEDAIAKKDGKRLLAYAKQAHDDGWACAARQMEDAAVSAGAPISEKEKEEIASKSKEEAEARAKMNLYDASKSAAKLGEQAAAVLALTLKPKFGGEGVETNYKLIAFEKKPTDKVVQQIEDLAAALGVAGYFFAQGQAKDLAEAARKKRDEKPISVSPDVLSYTGPSPAEFGGVIVAPTPESTPEPTEWEIRWPGIAAIPQKDLRDEALTYMTNAYGTIGAEDTPGHRKWWGETAHSLYAHASSLGEIGYPDAQAEVKALAADLEALADSGAKPSSWWEFGTGGTIGS